ncbi:MAG: hypothetical protein ACO4B5_12840 [Steroidobacteraceae bacterium]
MNPFDSPSRDIFEREGSSPFRDRLLNRQEALSRAMSYQLSRKSEIEAGKISKQREDAARKSAERKSLLGDIFGSVFKIATGFI